MQNWYLSEMQQTPPRYSALMRKESSMNERIEYKIVGEERMLKQVLLAEVGLSVTMLKKVKYSGLFVNGERVTVRKCVKEGDVVTVVFPFDDASDIEAIEAPLDILYEDEDILAVSKPTSMPVHPSLGNHLVTLANAVMWYYRDKPFVFRAVNRLDRDTSGIVLIAKNADAAHRLSAAMKRGEFTKEYLAIVDGVTDKCGTIRARIAREREGEMRRVVREDGKDAVTHYELIKTDGERSLVRIRLETGRTHQIRVHMAHIGHPLTNDFLYGNGNSGDSYKLHAEKLSFPHPRTGTTVTVTAPPPFDF